MKQNRLLKQYAGPVGNATVITYLVDELNPTGFAQVLVETIQQPGFVAAQLRQYVYGLDLISQRRFIPSCANCNIGTSTNSFYAYDGHGSVRQLTDSAGAVTDTYTYDAFGNLISRTFTGTSPTPNHYLYAGEQFDEDLNLYYNRARYLDVRSGRFWSMDSFEGSTQDPLSLHKYLYAGANPVNRTDPSGHDDLVELQAYTSATYILQSLATLSLKGALFGTAFGATDALLQGKSSREMFSAALKGGILGAVLGPLFRIKFVAPALVALGTVSGLHGTIDAIEQKNYPLAAFRAVATYVGFRTFVEDPVPSGGRLGSSNTRVQLSAYARFLRNRGWEIVGGGGEAPEEYLPGSGPGTQGSNFVDLTATRNGVTLRVNTYTALSDGVTPTAEEAASAALIRSKINPNDPFLLIPKWSLPAWFQ